MDQFFYTCIQYILGVRDDIPTLEFFDSEKFQAYSKLHHLQLIFTHLSSRGILKINLSEKNVLPLIQQHLRTTKDLLRITEILNQFDIPYVVLKGIPLNQQLYQNKCLRFSKDIDLLIPLPKLTLAHQKLTALGFQLVSEYTPASLKKQNKRIYSALKDVTYTHPQSRVEIELHWDTTITPQFGFIFSDIEAHRQLIFIENIGVHVLKNEYNFVYLCIHGSVSHWRRLKWLIDVGLFFLKHTLSWEKVIEIAKKHHALRCVFEAKTLLNDFGLKLPTIPTSKKDYFAVWIHKLYIHYLWRSQKTPRPITEQLLQLLLLHPRLHQKFGFLVNRLLFNASRRKKLLMRV